MSALLVVACQPVETERSASTDAASSSAAEAGAASPSDELRPTSETLALPCGVLDQRNWDAQISGSPGSLTVSGEIDLGTPGYGISLARDTGEAEGAQSTTLTLQLRPPTGVQPQIVTSHPVRYFAPAGGAYESVRIVCDGAELTTIEVRR